ncbi:VOC family protein [Pseudonocardia xishanensis]|uniref:VOC domain-containing protein n=1 Tax=Pseudonocardia xishanensis TaxID=630995 RepID=A0ABP8RLS6_9PSEU
MSDHFRHGRLSYLQLPAVDVDASRAFYVGVLGWVAEGAGFEAPELIGQWVTDRPVSADGGPMLWLAVDHLDDVLDAVPAHGGTVERPPYPDGGERWLAEVRDPAGTPLGLVARADRPRRA